MTHTPVLFQKLRRGDLRRFSELMASAEFHLLNNECGVGSDLEEAVEIWQVYRNSTGRITDLERAFLASASWSKYRMEEALEEKADKSHLKALLGQLDA